MGVVLFCRGCGYEHDNLWSCERARLERERAPALPAEPPAEKTGDAAITPAARYLASEARKHASGKKRGSNIVKPKPSVPGADLEVRLAATEKRLAEIREKQRFRTAKWRGKQKVPPPV